MIDGLSRLLSGEFGITGLVLGGLLVFFGIIIILATILLAKKKNR